MESKKEIRSPIKAIKAKCLDCCAGQYNEVKLCPCTDCALYPFRLGKNPYRKPISDERREMLRQRARERFSLNITGNSEEGGAL